MKEKKKKIYQVHSQIFIYDGLTCDAATGDIDLSRPQRHRGSLPITADHTVQLESDTISNRSPRENLKKKEWQKNQKVWNKFIFHYKNIRY